MIKSISRTTRKHVSCEEQNMLKLALALHGWMNPSTAEALVAAKTTWPGAMQRISEVLPASLRLQFAGR
jgi:hypothetical protein